MCVRACAPVCVCVCVSCRSLEEKAREYEISDLKEFLDSQLFRTSGFAWMPGQAFVTCQAL